MSNSVFINCPYDEQYKVGDWIVAKNDGIEMVLYYTKKIEPGEK